MSRFFRFLVAMVCAVPLATAVAAQDFSALARVDKDKSGFSDGWRGAVVLELALSQGVPWRMFHLDAPRRLVLDFREIDWADLLAEDFGSAEGIGGMRFGQYRPGWSRMVLDLDAPLLPDEAGLSVDEASGKAVLTLVLKPVGVTEFAARAGAPRDPRWDLPEPAPVAAPRAARPDWAPTIVVIDPGHGGIDPGAERGGYREKDLMLSFAREVRDTLRRAGGFEVVLTRDADEFVSLEGRVARAHQAQADVFISLHADALKAMPMAPRSIPCRMKPATRPRPRWPNGMTGRISCPGSICRGPMTRSRMCFWIWRGWRRSRAPSGWRTRSWPRCAGQPVR